MINIKKSMTFIYTVIKYVLNSYYLLGSMLDNDTLKRKTSNTEKTMTDGVVYLGSCGDME